jgi:hypothetical protein
MNLARHAAVLWRFRVVTVLGLLLGICLAVLASYQVSGNGLTPRGTSTYASESQILVTQYGFPEGRVTLPTGATGDSAANPAATTADPRGIQFADPNRFASLADLYTHLVTTDRVRARIPGHPDQSVISATLLPAVSGGPVLPIIQLVAKAPTAAAARSLNVASFAALRDTLIEDQRSADIKPAGRVQLSVIKASTPGSLVKGPSHTASILAFLMCLIATLAVVHLLAGLRSAPAEEPQVDSESDPGFADGEQLGEPRWAPVGLARAAAGPDHLRS